MISGVTFASCVLVSFFLGAVQARVTKVLPSVHGVFLARLIRRMLEMDTASGVNDRDYERLAFMYGLLLSEKCQVMLAFGLR